VAEITCSPVVSLAAHYKCCTQHHLTLWFSRISSYSNASSLLTFNPSVSQRTHSVSMKSIAIPMIKISNTQAHFSGRFSWLLFARKSLPTANTRIRLWRILKSSLFQRSPFYYTYLHAFFHPHTRTRAREYMYLCRYISEDQVSHVDCTCICWCKFVQVRTCVCVNMQSLRLNM